MATHKLLGLPPVPPELKSITPYLQRAEELKSTEPIVAYWCAYYAAQAGIALKAKDTGSRTLLFELLGTLEKMKTEIGPNDAIDMEAASAAYVENFALKVFGMADNEDRRGEASRSTAKKFLAAANFLEVLKTFPKSEISDATEGKVRYAKWKAADIAKAFREGRKPQPGPPGFDEAPSPSQAGFNDMYGSAMIPPPVASSSGSSSSPKQNGSPQKDPSHARRLSPPNHLPESHTSTRPTHLPVPDSRLASESDGTPGTWSTAATPGSGIGSANPLSAAGAAGGFPKAQPDSPTRSKERGHKKRRSGSGSSSESSARPSALKGASAPIKVEPRPADGHAPPSPSNGSPPNGNGKKVHFTPSVVGGLSSTTGSPPTTPGYDTSSQSSAPFSPDSVDFESRPPFNPYAPPQIYANQPPIPPPPQHYASPPQIYASPPPPIARQSPPQIYAPPIPPVVPAPEAAPVELSPAVFAKAQKHCRFAASALDYEDVEQAKKELRAALALLGG